MGLQVAAIGVALALLMVVAYRGLPVILFAPLCALLAVALSGGSLLPSYTETFMGGAADYVRAFFPVFLLGAVFGKLMESSGAAASVAASVVRALGSTRAIPAVVLACAVLTYGGVSLFVVAFAVYPFGAELFRNAGVPKRLLPGAIALGAFTFTMDALPGSPQIQNLIPTRYFGTDAYAAPVAGILGGTAVLVGGLAWLEIRRISAARSGEGYGEHHVHEPEARSESDRPPLVIALFPLLLVLICNLVLSRSRFSIGNWYSASTLRTAYPSVDLRAAAPTWALIISLAAGVTASFLLGFRRLSTRLTLALSTATTGALLAIFNTASEVGFGSVVKGLPGFALIRGWVLGVSQHVLISEALAVNVLAGITGSASGGLSIALEVMSRTYLERAKTQGVSPELLHRIAAMASGGMDTLPHNGAVITLLAITGLTHRQSYPDIFAITVIKTAVVFGLAIGASFLVG